MGVGEILTDERYRTSPDAHESAIGIWAVARRQILYEPGGLFGGIRVAPRAHRPYVDRPAARATLRWLIRAVHDDPRALQGDQPTAEHLIELREDGFDLFLSLDAFDHDRQIARQLEESVGVQFGARSKAHDPALHGGTRVVSRAQ